MPISRAVILSFFHQTYEHVMRVAFPAASRAAGRHIDQV